MPPGNNDLTDDQVNLIAQWIDEGALPEILEISGGFADVRIQSLPTSDPGVAGQIWSNSGVLTVSSG